MKDKVKLKTLSVKDIAVGERFRKEFEPKAMERLKEDIKKRGLISPVAVQEVDGSYMLLAGERRLRAAMELGMDEIPARIFSEGIDDIDRREIELMENIMREDMTWKEEIALKNEIYELQIKKYGRKTSTKPDAPGVSLEDVAETIGETKGLFAADIRLHKAVSMKPELFVNSKNKSDAKRQVKELERQFTEHVAVKEADTRIKEIAELDKELEKKGLKPKTAEEKQSEQAKRFQGYTAQWYRISDCVKAMAEIPDGNADFIEIDPPYSIDIQALKKEKGKDFSHTANYNEIAQDEYLALMRTVLSEAYRILKNDKWLVLWFGPDPWFEPLYSLATEVGFKGRRLCGEWVKPTGQTMQPDKYLANASEWFFYFAKGNPHLHKPGKLNTFVYPTVPPAQKRHPTERPIELMEDILDTFCYPNAIVGVPFAGSGNTLLAASNLKMRAWGYDLSEEYRASYVTKVMSAEPGFYRSLGK